MSQITLCLSGAIPFFPYWKETHKFSKLRQTPLGTLMSAPLWGWGWFSRMPLLGSHLGPKAGSPKGVMELFPGVSVLYSSRPLQFTRAHTWKKLTNIRPILKATQVFISGKQTEGR